LSVSWSQSKSARPPSTHRTVHTCRGVARRPQRRRRRDRRARSDRFLHRRRR
jgi:hypothetical protein